MDKPLFSDFNPVLSKQWKQKIQMDLKGADYNDTLIWKSNECINVKPFYHSDDFKKLPDISSTKASDFKICQTVFVDDIKVANGIARDAIAKGAGAIKFIIPSKNVVIERLLKSIDLDKKLIYLKLQFLSSDYVKTIPSKNTIILIDIIGNLTATGNWYKNLQEDHKQFETQLTYSNQFSIDANIYQNAGATMTQQLGYTLAHASEYLNNLDTVLSSEDKQRLQVTFQVSVGTNYFFEIAKLRALRELWTVLAEEFEVNPNCHIMATPTKRNKTIYDYNVNMLRTTTECMSAVLGGADSINNLAYDHIYHKDNEFGQRIARNQLLILKHESYFDKVDNPADGSYYIEIITNELSEKALTLFKDIEANGGFLNQLKEGTIQRKLKESAAKEQAQFDGKELILLGTNKYVNLEDKMADELELYPFVKTNLVKTLIEPIIEKRLAEAVEKERLNGE